MNLDFSPPKVFAKGQGLSTLLETVVRERIADLSY